MRIHHLFRPAMALLIAVLCTAGMAQTRYWIGGQGSWNDPSKWSTTPGGVGGAGVPQVSDDVYIRTPSASLVLEGQAWCRDLHVEGGADGLVIAGGGQLHIAGNWRMLGLVEWDHSGGIHMTVRNAGVELDLHGILLSSDLIFNGGGSWSVLSDIVLAKDASIHLRKGTILLNDGSLKAGSIQASSTKGRLIAGDGMVLLAVVPDATLIERNIDPGNSILVVGGHQRPWRSGDTVSAMDRDINVCGTDPGQTPFVVNAQLISDYNGYGVSCRGVCDATVNVTVTGGVGPFTYQWLNNGPPSATWTSACGGPQIVIVTDIGQGISCPASVNVSEPAPLGVIFFGQGTPPTCADVCNGSRTALAVGGVSPYTYSWNNGAGDV